MAEEVKNYRLTAYDDSQEAVALEVWSFPSMETCYEAAVLEARQNPDLSFFIDKLDLDTGLWEILGYLEPWSGDE